MAINLLEKGYNDVQAATPGESSPLPAGGYVCKVFNASIGLSKEKKKPQIILNLEINEGEFEGYFSRATQFKRQYDKNLDWHKSGVYYQLLFDDNGEIAPNFKGLLTCFEKSNPKLKINLANFEAQCLRGYLCGFVFGDVKWEYQGKSGIRLAPRFPKTVADILEGKFTVPELKKLQAAPAANAPKDDWGGTPVDPDDTPF